MMGSNNGAKPPTFVQEALEDAQSTGETWGHLPPRTPLEGGPPSAAAILAQVAAAPQKFAPFYERVAQMFSIPEGRAEDLLGPDGWRKAPLPGLEIKDVPDARCAEGTRAALVRFAAGMNYPAHDHTRRERVLILEGGYTDSSGEHYEAGDVHEMEPGSFHSFVVDPDIACTAASIADERVRFRSIWLRALAKLIGR